MALLAANSQLEDLFIAFIGNVIVAIRQPYTKPVLSTRTGSLTGWLPCRETGATIQRLVTLDDVQASACAVTLNKDSTRLAAALTNKQAMLALLSLCPARSHATMMAAVLSLDSRDGWRHLHAETIQRIVG